MSGDEQWCGYLWTLPTGRLGAARVSHKYMRTCTHAHTHTDPHASAKTRQWVNVYVLYILCNTQQLVLSKSQNTKLISSRWWASFGNTVKCMKRENLRREAPNPVG